MFAVDQFTTMQQDFDEDLALYASLGVQGIEVCERKLAGDPERAQDQLQRLAASDLTITSVQPTVHALFPDRLSPEPPDPNERMARLRQTIERFTDAFPGLDVPFVTIGGAAPGHDYRHAHVTARRLYTELADYAGARGVRIAFELLHPILMNADTFLCRLDEAVRLVEAVDRANFGLVIDLWQVCHEPHLCERIAALGERVGERVFVVHVSDWPTEGPRRLDDRLIPGRGALDWPALAEAFQVSGYRGAYCLEILSDRDLSDSLWRADAARVITDSRAALRAGAPLMAA